MHRYVHLIRIIICASVSGVYVITCLYSNNLILCSIPVYLLVVFAVAFIAFDKSWLCIFSYMLLYLSLGGLYIRSQALVSLFFGTVGIVITALIAYFRRNHKYVTVVARYNNLQYKFKALFDTGNLLCDPISGTPVMIVGADLAQEMTGLTVGQLKAPVTAINELPGARLIPYKTIGQSGVFLLGVYVPYLKIDSWTGTGIIAFSPELFGSKSSYQALTGGYL